MSIVPSQIVDFINKAFPPLEQIMTFYMTQVGLLRGLSDLLHETDRSLWPRDDSLVDFIAASAEIRALLEALIRTPEHVMGYSDFERNPVYRIREILKKCPDIGIPETTSGLEFIQDINYRKKLREELGAIQILFHERQWKAAIVMAGSLIEALLLNQISIKNPTEIDKTKTALNIKKNIEQWDLHNYIDAAYHMNLIKEITKTQALLAKDFRNLIHPGREIRMEQECTEAAALSALAGLMHVIEDLSH